MFVIKKNISLKELNTFGIDVSAAFYAHANTIEKIIFAINFASYNQIPVLVQGGGSNTLFTGDYEGVVIHPAIKSVNIVDDLPDSAIVRAGAGVVWDEFVEYCVGKGLYGIENLSSIPGDVGAAPVQNIGAYGVELKDTIYKIDAIDSATRKPFEITPDECGFGYRDSIFKREKGKAIITYVWFKLSKTPQFTLNYGNLSEEVERLGGATLQNVRAAVTNIRAQKLPDPKELGNAGSFFKNPVVPMQTYQAIKQQNPDAPMFPVSDEQVKLPAGWLIEQCGWKGKRMGRCGVYDKQALVLVNHGEATGAEVIELAQSIQKSVRDRFGVEIEMEVNVV